MRASRRSFASACCSALLVAASRRHGGAARLARRRRAAACRAAPRVARIARSTGAASARRVGRDPYVAADPASAKSIGHTSYVLKLTLDGGHDAVFKPRSKLPLGDRRYKGEIAAYRLATALGLDNVPRADPARLRRRRSSARCGRDFDAQGLVDDDGRVRGALMPVDRRAIASCPSRRARGARAGSRGSSTRTRRSRTISARSPRSISTMIAFDYVTANWDRWSGGNVAEDGATGKVLFVDNDGAFYEWPAPATLARQLAMVERVTRFSRRFVDALRALDEARLRDAALGEESPGCRCLPERVDRRRRASAGRRPLERHRRRGRATPATRAFDVTRSSRSTSVLHDDDVVVLAHADVARLARALPAARPPQRALGRACTRAPPARSRRA